jgi:hypothetical protein
MTFSESVSPDITEGLPTPLSRAQKASQIFTQRGIKFDCAIAGIPFFIPATDQNPYQRQTAPIQKQQIDTTREAGEQTLDGYWIRSQTNWDLGAGIRFYEPTLDQDSADRFEDSIGIDVWTKGKFSLLKSTSSIATVSASQAATVTGAVVGGVDSVFTNQNGTVRRWQSTATAYTGVTDALTKVTLAGSKILVGRATSIASGDTNGTVLADLWTGAASAPTPYWAKSRIIAVVGPSLWELTLAGGAWPATALHTHPDTNWKWSGVAEGPNAIYAAGYSNGLSAVYAFALADASSGSVPELGQAYPVLELPSGEEVLSIHVSLGTFMGIGTTKGFRVAAIQSDGSLALGPLLFDKPVSAITSGDRFFYGTVIQSDGNAGAFRVDLSQMIGSNSLRFPYAWDASTGQTSAAGSVALLGVSSRVCLGVPGVGIYQQSATDYVDSGYIMGGRIRYGTVIPKAFRLLSVSESTGLGEVKVYAVEANDSELTLRTISNGAPADAISLATTNPKESYRFKIELMPTQDKLSSPVIESMQVRALPSPLRQRLIQIPLLCCDLEESPIGTRVGREGYAVERLRALEYAEENFVVVTVQDFTTGETYEALIEQLSFRRPGPASTDGRTNFGGYVNLTVRKL